MASPEECGAARSEGAGGHKRQGDRWWLWPGRGIVWAGGCHGGGRGVAGGMAGNGTDCTCVALATDVDKRGGAEVQCVRSG